MREILGAVTEFDKAITVAKLKEARDRVRRRAQAVPQRDPGMVAPAQEIQGREWARVASSSRCGAGSERVGDLIWEAI
jgi:hypothetical protein